MASDPSAPTPPQPGGLLARLKGMFHLSGEENAAEPAPEEEEEAPPEPPEAPPAPCPVCGSERVPGQASCPDCGFFFPADSPAAAAAPRPSARRVKTRYEVGDLLDERGGVFRYRGRDL